MRLICGFGSRISNKQLNQCEMFGLYANEPTIMF